MEKLVLIDGNSLIYRAFYAMPLFLTKNGIYTNAVYGFMTMLSKIISSVNPTYVVVAFDRKEPTFRHSAFSGYKATRKPMPEELVSQVPLLKKVLNEMGIKTVEKAGVEADDIIGTYAKQLNLTTIIITGDRDSFQLVDESTSVYLTRKGISEIEIYNEENFKEKTGILPSQVIELKALMGDSSDNIPGVAGIGEKTALSLLNDYESLDGVYAHLSEIKGKLKEKIENGKDSAYLSRTLATINVSCGVSADIKDAKLSIPFGDNVRKIFLELEFKSLINKKEFFGDEMQKEEKPAVKEETVKEVLAKELNNELLEDLKNGEFYSLYIEDGVVRVYNGISETVFNLQVNLLEEGFQARDVFNFLGFIFNGKKTLIVYDKKAIKHYLKNSFDINLQTKTEDVSLMKYLCDFSGGAETLNQALAFYELDNLPKAYAIKRAYDILEEKLKTSQTESLYRNVELPLSDVLFEMECSGFKVDAESLAETGEKYRTLLDDLEKKIRELAKEDNLNVNSPKQLGEVLFEKLKLAKGKKTKTGYSTKVEVLEALESSHEIIPLILKYRRIQKLYSTYIEGFKPLIDKKTGLIHTTFYQNVTATGRLSSREPNLQNIPVRDDEGKELRKFFVPKSSDRILISADYSQIELRLLAAFSNCKTLIDAFNFDKDVHAETASRVFNVELDEVTSNMRRSAKAVNFGIIYGISEFGLSKNIGVSVKEARDYINSYFDTYKEVKDYLEECKNLAKEKGYSTTLLGRKRVIRELSSSNYSVRSFGERVAMNMPLQGSSADIIKLAMLGVSKRLKKEGLNSELILQVHDELIIDAFKQEKEKVVSLLKEEMEKAVLLNVKLSVDVGEGETWFDAK